MKVAFGIAFRSKGVSTFGVESAILNSSGRPMSGNVGCGTGRPMSGVVEQMKVVVGISTMSHSSPEKLCVSGLAVVFETNPLVFSHVTVDPSVT